MSTRNFLEEFKFQLFSSTMTNRLVIVNVLVFFFIVLLEAIFRLLKMDQAIIENFCSLIFTLDTNIQEFIFKPWGLFTSIFSHFDFWHLLFNMVFLYFSGTYFERLFGAKKLLLTYLFGGLVGGIFEIGAESLFPLLQNTQQLVVGASGSIMALFTALAFYSPNTKVNLFGIIPIKIYFIALFFLVQDLIGIGSDDHIAHFAHLGGATFGILSIRNIQSNKNILNRLLKIIEDFKLTFKGKKKTKNTEFSKVKTDEEYNYERKLKQEKTDVILDKIAKSGYESLSKSEKDFLFNQSKNG
jgi:membrane associated rhomboid family serine protease